MLPATALWLLLPAPQRLQPFWREPSRPSSLADALKNTMYAYNSQQKDTAWHKKLHLLGTLGHTQWAEGEGKLRKEHTNTSSSLLSLSLTSLYNLCQLHTLPCA